MPDEYLLLPIHIIIGRHTLGLGAGVSAFHTIELELRLDQVAKNRTAEMRRVEPTKYTVPVGVIALGSKKVSLRFREQFRLFRSTFHGAAQRLQAILTLDAQRLFLNAIQFSYLVRKSRHSPPRKKARKRPPFGIRSLSSKPVSRFPRAGGRC